MGKHRIRLDLPNGPWNDDKAMGPYYKINCQELHEFEEFMAQKLDDATILADSWRNQASQWQAKAGIAPERTVAEQEPDAIVEQLGAMLANGTTQCPLCGNTWQHTHPPLEILIYRNGVKYGRSIAPPSPPLPGLERDAERYRARRYTIYKDRLRIEMPQGKNWRPTTFEDFCAEYDADCDKEIEKQAAEISRLKGEGRKS